MRRNSVWLACALVAAALFLSACEGSTAQIPVATPTATVPPIPTATATPILAPTPLNVPAGWSVLVGQHFSLAYPNGWTAQSYASSDGSILYEVQPAVKGNQGVRVDVSQAPQTGPGYCMPQTGMVTLAGLQMNYAGATGEGDFMRGWNFINVQGTMYVLDAEDAQESATIQAQDNAILNTFRPDNPTPRKC